MSELTVPDGKDPAFIGLLTVVAIFTGLLFRRLQKKLPMYVESMCAEGKRYFY